MRLVSRDVPRARWALAALAVAALATGCSSGPGSAGSEESPSAPQATPTPEWADVGGRPVTEAMGTPSPMEQDVDALRVEPMPLPASCAAIGIEEEMAGVTGRLAEPEFTEVRTDTRLECSWAGFDPSEGSEVVMVTFAPEQSLVAYSGHVPVQAQRDPAFFVTNEVADLGGVAEWDAGEMFSGVKLHLPGLLVSTTTNTPRVEAADLLEAVTATAGGLVAEHPPAAPEASPSATGTSDPAVQADEGAAGGGAGDAAGTERG
ncbi:hypothetical protein ACFPZ0_20560 [Streptomonospora nanhaiensis]|uniref:DUF3558 domain-containing protein n=1 Tax=Streptomonospora nanhaiensis TaxID=1323731 RepID=A0A853BMK0_9ACTN|nr:hypothetical protein [Streptomonospora nanhaiensis]MBX9390470.1 hypothetical protein [Streptomonospora nanhaiensis]NYI95816.1 hypothetical protein [Streptomonospora nanhaiensis]